MKLRMFVSASVLTLAMTGVAHAAMITGSLSLSSTVTTGSPIVPVHSSGIATSLGSATGLDFTAGGTQDPGVDGQFQVDHADGDLAGLAGLTGSISDLMFTGPSASGYQAPPIAGFEVIPGAFSVDLLSITPVFQTNTFLLLEGTAFLSLDGFDPTPGKFALSAQQSGNAFSFSASESVPEPAVLSLFGLGLIAVATRVRKKRS